MSFSGSDAHPGKSSLSDVKERIYTEMDHAANIFRLSAPMTNITSFLSDDHNTCDDLFAAAENAVSEKDWTRARAHFDKFNASMRRHFAREEDVLFPAFETRTGMSGGPTFVMRAEHQQMNNLLTEMDAALEHTDGKHFLGLSETLLMLMRQHNMKEENILYPMSDQALADEQADLVGRMESMAL